MTAVYKLLNTAELMRELRSEDGHEPSDDTAGRRVRVFAAAAGVEPLKAGGQRRFPAALAGALREAHSEGLSDAEFADRVLERLGRLGDDERACLEAWRAGELSEPAAPTAAGARASSAGTYSVTLTPAAGPSAPAAPGPGDLAVVEVVRELGGAVASSCNDIYDNVFVIANDVEQLVGLAKADGQQVAALVNALVDRVGRLEQSAKDSEAQQAMTREVEVKLRMDLLAAGNKVAAWERSYKSLKEQKEAKEAEHKQKVEELEYFLGERTTSNALLTSDLARADAERGALERHPGVRASRFVGRVAARCGAAIRTGLANARRRLRWPRGVRGRQVTPSPSDRQGEG